MAARIRAARPNARPAGHAHAQRARGRYRPRRRRMDRVPPRRGATVDLQCLPAAGGAVLGGARRGDRGLERDHPRARARQGSRRAARRGRAPRQRRRAIRRGKRAARHARRPHERRPCRGRRARRDQSDVAVERLDRVAGVLRARRQPREGRRANLHRHRRGPRQRRRRAGRGYRLAFRRGHYDHSRRFRGDRARPK